MGRIRALLRASGTVLVAIVAGALFSTAAEAAPGDLDSTFSTDGTQRTDFLTGESQAAAVVRQPDGKIVAVGLNFPDADFAIARYNADGSPDTSFSGDGRQVTDFAGTGGDDRANGVALQSDGKIVVVGAAARDFAVARYNSNGSLDTSFSGDGKQTTDLGGVVTGDGANGVAIQANGKIVAVGVAGATSHASPNDFGLVRYNPNGSLDTTFSGDGKQRTDFDFESDEARGVAIQGDGKIVAVGGAGFKIARYNSNGSLDTTFSGDGRQVTDFGDFGNANAVALDSDGRIVAAGSGSGGAGSDFALARYNANGSLDTTFSGDGKQTTDFGDSDQANGVALQAGGKIVAVGATGMVATAVHGDFALARYNPNGSLDTTFSGDGKQTTDFGGIGGRFGEGATGVAAPANGKIVAVGTADESGISHFALARYNTDGTLDASFSGDGKQASKFGGSDVVNGVALQPDGKIVTVGATSFGVSGFSSQGAFALARYNANGSPDLSFSGDGRQTSGFADGASGVALQSDGKIVAVGTDDVPGDDADGGDFALGRYNPNGSLDPTFSGDGKQTTDFGPFDQASGVAIQANGKIVVVGDGGSGGANDFALARYNANGSLDTSFSGDGKQTTDFGGTDRASGVALQADGKIVVVGAGGAGADVVHHDFALARYNANGSLDTTFSGDGKQTTDFGGLGGSPGEGATGVAIQTNGKIVAVGATGGTNPNGGDSEFALARYNANGSLDPSFSGDGKQTTEFGGDDAAGGVALQAGGKIVVAGAGGLNSDFALARYNPNGSLDPTLSGDGRQLTNFGGDDRALGMALQGDGKIVAAGVGFGTDRTNDFAVARYLGG